MSSHSDNGALRTTKTATTGVEQGSYDAKMQSCGGRGGEEGVNINTHASFTREKRKLAEQVRRSQGFTCFLFPEINDDLSHVRDIFGTRE